jgi:hypothetical protein
MAIVKQLKQTTCTLREYLVWYCGYWKECEVTDKELMQLCNDYGVLIQMEVTKEYLVEMLHKEVKVTDIPNLMCMGGSHAVHIKGDGIEFFITAMDNAFSDEEESIL